MNWPKVKLSGGPHAKNTVIEVDGEPVKAVHHVDVAFDVNDAVRVNVSTFAEHVEVETEGYVRHRVVVKDRIFNIIHDSSGEVDAPDTSVETFIRYDATGDSLVEALEQVLEQARRDHRSPGDA